MKLHSTCGKPAAEFLILASGNAVGVVVSIAVVRLLTEHMSAEAYGRLALLLTFGVFVNQVYMAGLSSAAARLFASAKVLGESGPLFRAVRSAYARHLPKVIALATLFGWFCIWVAEIGAFSSVLAITLVSLIGGLNSIAIGILNAARWRSSVAMLNSADSLLRLTAIVAWVHQGLPMDPATVLWIQVTSGTACLLVALFRWRTLHRSHLANQHTSENIADHGNWRVQLRGYGRPLAILGAVTFIHHVSDRWALNAFLGSEGVGLFAALYQLGFLPFSLLSALTLNLLSPIVFDAAESHRTATADRGLRLNLQAGVGMLLLTLSACGIGLAYGEAICGLALGEPFRVIAPLLPWALLAAGLFETGQLLALRLQARMAMRQLMWIKGSVSCLGVAMNVFGAAYGGLGGLIWAMLTFSILYAAAISAWVVREARTHRRPLNPA